MQSRITITGTSRVYKLYNNQTDDFYIGSTMYSLAERLRNHVNDAHRGRQSRLYKKMRELGTQVWAMEELSSHTDIDLIDLRTIEKKTIEELKPTLNSNSPISTREEQKAQYDHYTQKRMRCECGAEFDYRNKTNHLRTNKHKNEMMILRAQQAAQQAAQELADAREMAEQSFFD